MMYGDLAPAHAASASSASDETALNDNFPLPLGSGTSVSPELTRPKLGRSLIWMDWLAHLAPNLPFRGKRDGGRGKGEAHGIEDESDESVGDGRNGGHWRG